MMSAISQALICQHMCQQVSSSLFFVRRLLEYSDLKLFGNVIRRLIYAVLQVFIAQV